MGSIRAKLLLLCAGPALLAALAVGVVLTVWQTQMQTAALEARVARYGDVAAQQVRSAVAFDDRETARETLDATASDPDVSGIQLIGANGSVLYDRGRRFEPSVLGQASTPVHHAGNLVVTRTVQSIEGPRGTLIIALSTSSLGALRDRIIGTAGAVALGAGLLGCLLAIRGGRKLSGRIAGVAELAGRIGDGDLDVPPIEIRANDEIDRTATAVNAMVVRLREAREREAQRASSERERLEAMVDERTEQLASREHATRVILEHLDQGVLMITATGVIVGERSRATEVLFGRPIANGDTLVSRVEGCDRRAALAFELGFSQLAEGVLPLEVALYQLPETLELAHRHLALTYTPMSDREIPDSFLVTITDVTAERERAEAREAEDEAAALFRAAASDRHGLRRFAEDARTQVATIDMSRDLDAIRAALHTLKGNASMLGLTAWAKRCHRAEDRIEELGEITGDLRRAVVAAWDATADRVGVLIGATSHVEIAAGDFAAIRAIAEQGTSWRDLRAALRDAVLEPVVHPMRRLATHCRELAARRGLGAVETTIDHRGVRLDPSTWAPLWAALAHVARNAVIHGMRDGRSGRIAFRAGYELDAIALEISDDGGGIDWDALAERARAAGLPHATRAELVRAMFAPRITTRDAVDGDAGRGVGLSAVAATCVELGVEIDVVSERDAGTTFRFRIPIAPARAELHPVTSQSCA